MTGLGARWSVCPGWMLPLRSGPGHSRKRQKSSEMGAGEDDPTPHVLCHVHLTRSRGGVCSQAQRKQQAAHAANRGQKKTNPSRENNDEKNSLYYAWPVSPGDALVPVPAVAWLVAGAFAGIGAAAKRRAGTGTA